ncbi:mitochondrial ribosome recycling factor 1 [Arctopsyche grandis]|uniref:mitochondrial ribosome recycling factor 1 n=1 Tax=Arctopsyche grandis TaxID=121162 RepID=UPI00406D9251
MNLRLFYRPVSDIFRKIRLISTPIVSTSFDRLSAQTTGNILPCQFHTATCKYGVKRIKGKDNKNNKNAKVHINNSEIQGLINLEAYKNDLQQPIDRMKDDYVKYVSLRSAAGSMESMKVSFEEKTYELQELAQVVRKNPKTIVLNMVSFPQAIPAVLQAIEGSGLNLNPQQDGTTIFIPVPKVTTEHREQLSKNAKVLFIKYRDVIKDTENNYIKKVRSMKEGVSEDVTFSVQKQLTALSSEYIMIARKLLIEKQSELMGKS